MNKKLFIAVIILAAVLRLYKLDAFPVSLSWDEVAIGYNAFSISEYATDEYGSKWPLLFRSFNDFKLPGYIYVDALFIRALGLSALSVRLPSALFGVLAVISFYFLTKYLFKYSEFDLKIGKHKIEFAIVASFVLAISPWHIQFSRGAFEANIALTLVIIGLTLFLYGLKHRLLLILSLLTLSLSIYFYYSPRIFMPAVVISVVLIYKQEIFKQIKNFAVGAILSALLIIPITLQIFSTEGLKRVKEVSILEDQTIIREYVDAKAISNNPLAPLFLNRRIPIIYEAGKNYFSNLSIGFLIFGDDPNHRHRAGNHGNMYLYEIPLLLVGLWVILRRVNPKARYFILTWIIIAPFPAAFAKENPHALRSILLIPPLILIIALGLVTLAKIRYFRQALLVLVIIFAINYLYSYYTLYPLRNSSSWAYGYKQMYDQISTLEGNYDRVIITGHYWKPHIFYLFYNKIDPVIYFTNSTQESIGKFRFGTTYWDSGGKNLTSYDIENLKGVNTLLALSPAEYENLKNPDKFSLISAVIDFSGKDEIFLIGQWR